MSWSYSGDPAYNSRDKVRFLIQDTNSADQLLADEEVDWLLGQNSDAYMAAASAADTIAGKYARVADSKSIGDLSVSYSSRASRYESLAAQLRTRAGRTGAAPTPYAGGIRISDRDVDLANTDLTRRFSFKVEEREYAPGDEIE